MIHQQNQRLNELLDTVNQLTTDSIATWHQTLADEVKTAITRIEQVTVAASQAALVGEMVRSMENQQTATAKALELPLRALGKLVSSGHLADGQKVKLLVELGKTHMMLVQWDTALDAFYRALDYCQGDLPRKAEIFNLMAHVKSKQQDYGAAKALLQESLAIYQQLGDDHQVAQVAINLGWNTFRTHDYEAAQAYYQQATETVNRLEDADRLIADITMNRAILATVRGEFDTALSHYEACLPIFERLDDTRGLANAHYNLGLLYVDLKQLQKAGQSYQRALEHAQNQNNLYLMGLIHLSYTELALKLSDYELAQACCMHAIKTFGRMGTPSPLADAYRYAAQIQHHERAWEKATACFEKGIATAQACGARLNEAEAHYEYGVMLMSKPDMEAAKRHLTEAERLFTQLGAQADVHNVQTALSQLAQQEQTSTAAHRFKRIERRVA